MERPAGNSVGSIRVEEYAPAFDELNHVFLAGDLQKPCPNPFFRDTRVEVIACQYAAGDDGLFHWHTEITEYEYVLEGSVTYVEAATGEARRFHVGDLSMVPAGVCVQRLVDERCRTLAVKAPSRNDKIHCRECERACERRVEEFGG